MCAPQPARAPIPPARTGITSRLITNFILRPNASLRVTEVRVSPPSGTVAIGQAQRLTASAFDADGSLVVIRSDQWPWSSSLPAVATVAPLTAPDGDKADVSGLCTGTAMITVTEDVSALEAEIDGVTNLSASAILPRISPPA